MAFNPKHPPCSICGREVDECVCGLAPDLPDDMEFIDREFEDDTYLEWDLFEEINNENDQREDHS